MGEGGQPHTPTASNPRKDPVPILQEAGWAPGPVRTGRKSQHPPSPPSQIRSWTAQPIVIRYTDRATWPTHTHRVSQEEYARLQEGVPYVKVYRYNPKHLCPKLNS